MPKYALKILLDLEARDDLEARRRVGEILSRAADGLTGVREIVLHSLDDRKSMKFASDGSPAGEWQHGGRPTRPGPTDERS